MIGNQVCKPPIWLTAKGCQEEACASAVLPGSHRREPNQWPRTACSGKMVSCNSWGRFLIKTTQLKPTHSQEILVRQTNSWVEWACNRSWTKPKAAVASGGWQWALWLLSCMVGRETPRPDLECFNEVADSRTVDRWTGRKPVSCFEHENIQHGIAWV